ncbi:disintegrin and metalloproteinase domain-containing protein 10-like isoform X1 [Tachypleus tridentatus]|uniref:disintegrin and metalloproteinase domain-containing protein 10-like isoform X1 n=1 Tax=Tachypleus tridentatus TaxID=6853 RepID=UPI003FD4C2BC
MISINIIILYFIRISKFSTVESFVSIRHFEPVELIKTNIGLIDYTPSIKYRRLRHVTKTSFFSMSDYGTNEDLYILFRAFQRIFDIHLTANSSVFSSKTKVDVLNKKGREINHEQYDIPKNIFYTGYLRGMPRSTVYGYIRKGYFIGTVRDANDTYYTDIADKNYFRVNGSYGSVIYKYSDIIFCNLRSHNICKEIDIFTKGPRRIDILTRSRRLPTLIISQSDNQEVSTEERSTTSQENKICSLELVADHTFYSSRNSDREATLSEMFYYVHSANDMFMSTDFNVGFKVGFLIEKVTIFSNVFDTDNPFFSSDGSAEQTLDSFTSHIQNKCLALGFLHRDFPNDILGLAYKADSDPRNGYIGGICEPPVNIDCNLHSYNTLLVTTKHNNRFSPKATTALTVAHEFGHSFGSPHDSPYNPKCTPGGVNGQFLMNPYSNDGSKVNHKSFSSCSRAAIATVIQTKGKMLLLYFFKCIVMLINALANCHSLKWVLKQTTNFCFNHFLSPKFATHS